MNPQPSVTPVQRYSQWKAVRTNDSISVQMLSSKSRKTAPLDIHRHMQAVHGDKFVDVRKFRRLVREFKQEELGEASLCDKARSEGPVKYT